MRQQPGDAFASPAPVRLDPLHAKRLRNDLFNGHPRIERGIGILKYDLSLASKAPQGARIQRSHVRAVEDDLPRGRFHETEKCAPDRRFAGAGFARQSEDLPRLDHKADIIDGAHMADDTGDDAAANLVPFAQVADFQNRWIGHGSRASATSFHRRQRTMW